MIEEITNAADANNASVRKSIERSTDDDDVTIPYPLAAEGQALMYSTAKNGSKPTSSGYNG